jgi:hypothetical protein
MGLGLMGLAALGVWSCSSDTEDAAKDNAAGHGGTAGATGHPQGGSDAGVGGGGAGDGGIAGAGGAGTSCEPNTVRDYCAWLESRVVPEACPEGPDDFDLGGERCGRYNGVERYASDCGGVVIEVWGDKMNGVDYYSSYYSFDAQGVLVGVGFATDTADICPSVWGAPCARVGDPQSLCEAGGAGGQGGGSGGIGLGGEGGSIAP